MVSLFKKRNAYRIVLLLVLIISLIYLWQIGSQVLVDPKYILGQDFAQIWAAGRLNLIGANPYDPIQIQQVKNAIVAAVEEPQVITLFYSPPWSLPLAMIFAGFPYLFSRIIWLLISIIILLICADRLWKLYTGPKNLLRFSWLIVFSFGPTYLMLSQGQVTYWILLALVGFLGFIENKKYDYMAGACVALACLKPQLLYIFFISLFVWAVSMGRYKVLVGFCLAILGATIIGLLFNHHLFYQYFNALHEYPPIAWFTPTLGAFFRLIFGVDKFWLQYPSIFFGLLWLGWYWYHHRKTWGWRNQLPLLLFASFLTTPYAWTYDQVLLLVGLIPAWIVLLHADRRQIILFGTFYALINLAYLILHKFFTDEYFIWLVPVLLVWHWLASRSLSVKSSLEKAPAID
jgi:hypothetical protein